jgi:outer membrane receptor protein involved in Fe transport
VPTGHDRDRADGGGPLRRRPGAALPVTALLALLGVTAVAGSAEEPKEGSASPQDRAAAAPSQDEPSSDLPRLEEQVTVTATRTDTPVGDTPASVAVVSRPALDVTAAPTVDDAFRQVVGFSLFRRTGSLTANPTVQGVSLRGLGASGASRALVLLDGLPLNDPFGGWVYWGRVPRLAVERLEVLRGGASGLYGSGALAGVAQVVTRRPGAGRGLRAEGSVGGSGFLDAGLHAHATGERWSGWLAAQGLRTEGYLAVAEAERGPVDRPVASRHGALDGRVARRVGGEGQVFLRGAWFSESRGNGTSLQENDTWIGLFSGGYDGGPWSLRAWGSTQELEQAFSAVAPDRESERLTRRQRVPAGAFGVTAQWSRGMGARHHLLVGAEGRRVTGTTHETGYLDGVPTSRLEAGGNQLSGAAFVAERFQAHPRLLVSATGRLDAWAQRDGRSLLAAPGGSSSEELYPDRSETAFSPRLGVLFRVSPALALTGSAYGAFRGPTLNELYRGFRVGDIVTRANPALTAERLWGGEAGALLSGRAATLRMTVFDAKVRNAVANVTLETTPSLVTRQRQNLGHVRSRGLEVEAEARLAAHGLVSAGYTLIDSRITEFPPDPSLEGRALPHIPRHQAVLQARYESAWRLGLQARWLGDAYENDRNTLVLDSAFLLDLFVSRRITDRLEAFVAAENLLDADVVVGRTPVETLGAPRTVRGGLRFSTSE